MGWPPRAVDQLGQLCDATGAEELIITTIELIITTDRLRSYEPLAGEWSQR